jgi:hypothetical protein
MKLYGREWSRREFEARVGRIEQVGGVRRLRWAEGVEEGVIQYQVRTGAGLSYYVSPSRALDISLAEFGGVPISWQSPNGDVHPAYYDARGSEWLRTGVGGLLMTCGLDFVGAPEVDQGQAYGLHGRAHHLPARHVSSSGKWEGDNYLIKVSGEIEQVAIFGEHLRLSRSISSRLGENKIIIEDIVENAGFSPTPHMILYHFNFGFPLLSENTEVRFPSRTVIARDEGTPIDGFDRWETPQPDFLERVYYHLDFDDDDVSAHIFNPEFPMSNGDTSPLTVSLNWSAKQLPKLVEWKMPGAVTHVMGIEPANCYVEGRSKERADGTLVILKPGETRTYRLSLEIAAGPEKRTANLT